jgi:RNA polymerase sigma factor (sigma-70 family)
MGNLNWGNIFADEGSYQKLYTYYYKKFYNYGKKFTPSSGLIEDSIQEIFLDMWVNRQKLPAIRSMHSYLFSSFRYTLLRKIRGDKKIVSSEEFEAEPAFSIEYDLLNQGISHELLIKLKKALNTLTPRQREAIFLRFYQKLSYEEVAEILNITVKATYKIMARSLAALKDNMILSVAFALPV